MSRPNISSYDPTPSILCRVHGLTSDEGKKKNGSVGHVNLAKSFGTGADIRHPVCLDGFKSPISVKRSNLEVFSEEEEVNNGIMVAIGRECFFDSTYQVIIGRNTQTLGQTPFKSSKTARTEGNLEAVEMVLKNHKHGFGTGPIIFKLSDLNLARALNRVAFGDEEVKVAAPLNKKFQRVKRLFPKEDGQKKVMVKYDPHRLWPDKFLTKLEKRGTQRYEAAKLGTYQIYPSSHQDNLDAIELFYADGSGKRKNVIIQHEIYIDYGVEEAIVYARHVCAMNETYRLYPDVLAGADPHAFWSAILWIERFTKTLQKLQLPPDLIDEWKLLQVGRKKSLEHFKSNMKFARFDPALLRHPEENWGIGTNEGQHMKIAAAYTICAVEAMNKSLKGIKGISSVTVVTLGQFKGTEMWRYIRGTTMFKETKDRRESKSGNDLSAKVSINLYRQCMRLVGFDKESRFWEGPAFLDLSQKKSALEKERLTQTKDLPELQKAQKLIEFIVNNFLRYLMFPILGTSDYDTSCMWNVLYKKGARQRIHQYMENLFFTSLSTHPQYQSRETMERLIRFKWGSSRDFNQEPIFPPMQEKLYEYLKQEERSYDNDE